MKDELKKQTNRIIERLISNVSNIKNRFKKTNYEDFDDYLNQISMQILDSYQSIIITKHESYQIDFENLKIHIEEK